MPYAPLPHIVEDSGDLRRRLHAERDPERKRRLHALVLFASGEAATRVEVARHLAVDRQTVARWLDRYRDGGLDALLTRAKPGPAPGQRTLPEPVLAALRDRLDDQAGFGGYHKVQAWLHDEFGLRVPYKTVYTLVRYRLKAKLKVPRPEHPKKV
jgi:transposase